MVISQLFNTLKTWSHGIVKYTLEFVCILYAYICIYLCICIFVCVYFYVSSSVYIYASLYICVGTHLCVYKSYLFNCLSCRYLGCCLSGWHCYLGSIPAFSFEFLNLNTTTSTKSSTKIKKINIGNMDSYVIYKWSLLMKRKVWTSCYQWLHFLKPFQEKLFLFFR